VRQKFKKIQDNCIEEKAFLEISPTITLTLTSFSLPKFLSFLIPLARIESAFLKDFNIGKSSMKHHLYENGT
jgi:hypothetical protein